MALAFKRLTRFDQFGQQGGALILAGSTWVPTTSKCSTIAICANGVVLILIVGRLEFYTLGERGKV